MYRNHLATVVFERFLFVEMEVRCHVFQQVVTARVHIGSRIIGK